MRAPLLLVLAASVSALAPAHADEPPPWSCDTWRCDVRELSDVVVRQVEAKALTTHRAVRVHVKPKGTAPALAVLGRLSWIEDLELWSDRDSPGDGRERLDIAPLAGLSQLKRLWLQPSRYSLTSAAPIARLARLRELALYAGDLQDLAWIQGLLHLESVSLDGLRVADLTPLASLAWLKKLEIEGTGDPDGRVDLAPLAMLEQLTHLVVAKLGVSDLAPVGQLPSLVELKVDDNPRLASLTPLAGASSLEKLHVRRTAVADLRPLARLSSLRELVVSDTRVADLKPLARLTTLRSLSASNTGVRDLRPLAKLAALEKLELQNTPVTDVKPLAKLAKLGWLDLSCTGVRDPLPLRQLTELSTLELPEQTPPAAVAALRRALPKTSIRLTPNAWCKSATGS